MSRAAPLLFFAALAGCSPPEEIRRYSVQKPEKPAVRLLAAVLTGGDKVWFVKLTGKPDAVEAAKADFEQFVGSMTFAAGNPPVTYTVPAGWREMPGKQAMRHATFAVGPDKLELIITPLGQEAAALKPNVDRWRGQIGLPPIPEAELPAVTRAAELGGKKVTLVDMTGTGDLTPMTPPRTPVANAPGPPKAADAATLPKLPAAPPREKPITYQVPDGWTEFPPKPGGFRVANFKVGQSADGRPVEATVSPLSGRSGSLLDNVNRWRKEVSLPELAESELSKNVVPMDVGGLPGYAVDFAGPASGGAGRERTLGLVLPRGDTTWYVKLRGPHDLVAGQKAAFETFTKSLRFTDAGGKP
jgi:hypothetical protein